MKFVLIHGAWHDGSAWDGVLARLEQQGHTAFAPTLAGHGKDVDKSVNHNQCTQSAIDYILQRDIRDFVLVGHSFGGTIISKVAEAIPERIRRLVFYAGLVMNDGESVYDASSPEQRMVMDQLISASSDGTIMLPFDYWRDAYIGDAHLEVARWAYEQLSPQPAQTFMDRLDMKTFQSLLTPRSYLLGTEDCAMPPGEWHMHPRMTSRLGVYRLVQMPGGHELMFSNPRGLVEKIIQAGRD